MRARAFLPMFLFAVSLPAWGGEEKKEDAIKVDLSYLEKTWGIKYKSHTTLTDGNRVSTVTILMEFTKDVENLKELREAFTTPKSATKSEHELKVPLWFYFFDEENVVLGKSFPMRIWGEVTGKKGDAIRVSVSFSFDLKTLRKIEARPREKDKEKDKEKK